MEENFCKEKEDEALANFKREPHENKEFSNNISIREMLYQDMWGSDDPKD